MTVECLVCRDKMVAVDLEAANAAEERHRTEFKHLGYWLRR